MILYSPILSAAANTSSISSVNSFNFEINSDASCKTDKSILRSHLIIHFDELPNFDEYISGSPSLSVIKRKFSSMSSLLKSVDSKNLFRCLNAKFRGS